LNLLCSFISSNDEHEYEPFAFLTTFLKSAGSAPSTTSVAWMLMLRDDSWNLIERDGREYRSVGVEDGEESKEVSEMTDIEMHLIARMYAP
jgi:hypothetical protein